MHREELYVRVRWPFRSAARWYREYEKAWYELEHGAEANVPRAYDRRVLAVWGLVVRARESVPFALQMLRNRNAEIRADATSVLERLCDDERGVAELIRVVETEQDLEPLDAAVGALERLRPPAALPALASVVRDDGADGDTRFGAALAVAAIAGERFRRGHEVEDAAAWLDREGVR